MIIKIIIDNELFVLESILNVLTEYLINRFNYEKNNRVIWIRVRSRV